VQAAAAEPWDLGGSGAPGAVVSREALIERITSGGGSGSQGEARNPRGPADSAKRRANNPPAGCV